MKASIVALMKNVGILSIILGLTSLGTSAGWAQQKMGNANRQLTGTWTIVSVYDERPDGTKVPLYGEHPDGLLMFDAHGRYSLQLCATDRPKFAANDRAKGTDDEDRAAVKGCNPHWGLYSLDQKNKIIVFKIEHALFANWEGTEQKRKFTLTGDELKYNVPNPATAAVNAVVIWKRAR